MIGLPEESEPPIRRPRFPVETRSPERVKLSEELAILNRPLADEIEYYDEVPRARAQPVFAAVMVLAALGGAGYWLLAQRHHTDDRAAAATAAIPAKAPVPEPVPAAAPVAPIAAGTAAEAERSPSEVLGEPEPEGDPTPSGRRHADRRLRK